MKKWTLIFQVLAYLLWIGTIIYYGISYFHLPDVIPIHFGITGKADSFGSKNTIGFEILIMSLCFALTQYTAKHPDSPLLNMPKAVKENTPLAQFFVQMLSTLVMLLFADISYESVQIALGKQMGISFIALGITGLVLVAAISVSVYGARWKKNHQVNE